MANFTESTLLVDNITTAQNTSNFTNQFAHLSKIDILLIAAPQVVLIDRIVSPIWYIIGLIGNPISAIIWLSR